MLRRVVVLLALVLIAAPVTAQRTKFEFSPFVGYSLSDGFNTRNITVGSSVYDGITMKDGLTFGASLGYFVNPVTEIEFQWARQQSQLQGNRVTGGKTDFMDVAIDNYHVNFVYNMYNERRKVRPFFLFGLGATVFNPDKWQGNAPDNEAFFSGTLGTGIKASMTDNIGVKLMARWTPTYIHSTNAGYWCDVWGCWAVGNSEYENQFGFTAGLTWRFGS